MKDINKKRLSLFLGSALALSSLAFPFSLKTETASALGATVEPNVWADDPQPEYLAPFYPFSVTYAGQVTTEMDDYSQPYIDITVPLTRFIPAVDTLGFTLELIHPYQSFFRGQAVAGLYPGNFFQENLFYYRDELHPNYALALDFAYAYDAARVVSTLYKCDFFNEVIPLDMFMNWLGGSELSSMNLWVYELPSLIVDFSYTLYYEQDGTLYRARDSYLGVIVEGDESSYNYNNELVQPDGYIMFGDLISYTDLDNYMDYVIDDSFLYFESFSIEVKGNREIVNEFYMNGDYLSVGLEHNILYEPIPKATLLSYQRSLNQYFSRNIVIEDSPIDSILSVVDSFFSTEIFPGFYVSYFLYIGVAGLIIGFAIKIFLQG